MKKLVTLLLSLALVLSLAACGGEATPDASDDAPASSQNEESTENDNTENQIVFEEVVAIDNAECAVKITEIDPDNMWGYTLKAQLENKSTEKTYMFSVESASINGVQCDPMFASEVAAGKKANEEINFSTDTLEENGIVEYTDIELTFNGNPHAHILLTMRPLDEKGTWAAKSKKEYVLDENGERVKLPSGRYKTRKVDLMDWNRQENADLWRKAWADLANDYLERSGSAERIDHRSHAERGIEELPTVHMGVAASQMEKKGIATDKGEINRMIQKTNRLMREIRGYIDSLKEWLAEVFAAKKQLQAAPHSPDIATLLTRYLSIEREKSRKYSQGWQQQHTAGELQKISKAIVYLQSKGIATLEDLDAALSSVDEEAKRLNTSVVAKQKRMRTLEKFIEHGSNYNRLKPIHDELKTLKNGWGKKREKFEQAHESDLIIWNAANRFLHANLPEGTKSFKVSEWQKEFDELKAQSTGEYEELKTKRSEVKELQQIRKCIDIVEQAEQRTQEQTHQTPRRKKEDISL